MRTAALAGVMTAVLLSVAIAALVLSADRFDQAGQRAAAAGATAQRSTATLQAIADMETGLRDFLLTGDAQVLGPWHSGRHALDGQARRLIARTDDRRARVAAVRILRGGRSYAADYAGPLIAARLRAPLAPARVRAAVAAGRRRVDALRRDIHRVEAADQARDRVAIGVVTARAARDRGVGIGAVGVALAILLACGVLLRRDMLIPLRSLQRAAERLSSGDLSARVPRSGGRELDTLTATFNHMAGELAERGRVLVGDLESARLEVLQRLARATEYRDDDTHEHTERVASLAARVATILGLGDEDVAMLRLAAPLHDVGKIGVPDSILLKPGALTEAERAQMQRHTTIGADMLGDSGLPVLQMAETIALGHHERWDGRGYPHGRAGEEVPLAARIVAVADVFDALTTARPYKDPWPVDDAVAEIIAQSGRQFDPRVVRAFAAIDPATLAAPPRLGVGVAGPALAQEPLELAGDHVA